jgi:hypothetical protein
LGAVLRHSIGHQQLFAVEARTNGHHRPLHLRVSSQSAPISPVRFESQEPNLVVEPSNEFNAIVGKKRQPPSRTSAKLADQPRPGCLALIGPLDYPWKSAALECGPLAYGSGRFALWRNAPWRPRRVLNRS